MLWWTQNHVCVKRQFVARDKVFPLLVVYWIAANPREGPAPTPLIFKPNWCPKGRKKLFWETTPLPLYVRVWMISTPPPPPSQSLDPALLYIYTKICSFTTVSWNRICAFPISRSWQRVSEVCRRRDSKSFEWPRGTTKWKQFLMQSTIHCPRAEKHVTDGHYE